MASRFVNAIIQHFQSKQPSFEDVAILISAQESDLIEEGKLDSESKKQLLYIFEQAGATFLLTDNRHDVSEGKGSIRVTNPVRAFLQLLCYSLSNPWNETILAQLDTNKRLLAQIVTDSCLRRKGRPVSNWYHLLGADSIRSVLFQTRSEYFKNDLVGQCDLGPKKGKCPLFIDLFLIDHIFHCKGTSKSNRKTIDIAGYFSRVKTYNHFTQHGHVSKGKHRYDYVSELMNHCWLIGRWTKDDDFWLRHDIDHKVEIAPGSTTKSLTHALEPPITIGDLARSFKKGRRDAHDAAADQAADQAADEWDLLDE